MLVHTCTPSESPVLCQDFQSLLPCSQWGEDTVSVSVFLFLTSNLSSLMLDKLEVGEWVLDKLTLAGE